MKKLTDIIAPRYVPTFYRVVKSPARQDNQAGSTGKRSSEITCNSGCGEIEPYVSPMIISYEM